MSGQILRVSDDFWNIRGSFRVGGLIDVGTHVSLVRLGAGKFVFLDSYTLPPDVEQEVNDITNGGENVEAIINLHPFHTVHVENMHQRYPAARLFGTARHHKKFPGLPWDGTLSESPEMAAIFAGDFEFSVPRGVDFISANEHVHFSSVLVYHRASKTIHVDDTINHMRLPSPLRWAISDMTGFHPTLSKALEKREEAAAEFQEWAAKLIDLWGDAENLCAAHNSALIRGQNQGDSIKVRLEKALDKVNGTLLSHEKRYG